MGRIQNFTHIEEIEIERRGILPETFYSTARAVYRETTRGPTHYLVGWATLLEIDYLVSGDKTWSRNGWHQDADDNRTFMGIPVCLDPTRRECIIAVPCSRFLIGRTMPSDAMWFP